MKIPLSHRFAATPERVFAALTDPVLLERCIDGCEKMTKTAPDTYEIQIKVGLGAVKGSYRGKIRVSAAEPPSSLTLSIDGSGAPGFLKATAQIRLAAQGEGTQLSGEGEGSVGGLIAAVGSRLIEAAAKKMSADFFQRLAAQITSNRAS